AASAHVVPGEVVRRRGNCAEQRRTVIELNLTDRVAVGGDGGGQGDGGRRDIGCAIGRRSQRDKGSTVRKRRDRVSDLTGIVALQPIGIVSSNGEEIGDAGGQVCDGLGRRGSRVDDISVGLAGYAIVEAVTGNGTAGIGIPGQSHTALSLDGRGERSGDERRSK